MPVSDGRIDAELTDRIESTARTEEDIEVGIDTAKEMLGIRSIDKEFDRLRETAAATQFKYSPKKARQGLRPYQLAALQRMEKLARQNTPLFAVQLPTGAGKTFLVHAFSRKNYLTKNKSVLIVTPSWEIANQHAMTVAQHFPDGSNRVCRLGGRGQLIASFPEHSVKDARGKVIITTAALFHARQKQLRDMLNVDLVVIDEGHHGWMKKRLNCVQAFAQALHVPAILLTATPPRDMEKLPFAVQLRYLDLVPEYLVPCQVVRLETGEEFDPILKNGVLANSSRLEISVRRTRFEKIVAQSLPHIKGQAIYYAGSVREAMGVVKEFAKHGLTAVVVHSKWTQKCDRINALAIERFRSGKAQVLVNVQMLAMGFDVPNVETVIVARPVESDTLFTQMVGRGARPRDLKHHFILIDVHDTIHKPDVAKIFEHRELFYKGSSSDDATRGKIHRPRFPVIPVQPFDANLLTGFPYCEGVIDEHALLPLGIGVTKGQAGRTGKLDIRYYLRKPIP